MCVCVQGAIIFVDVLKPCVGLVQAFVYTHLQIAVCVCVLSTYALSCVHCGLSVRWRVVCLHAAASASACEHAVGGVVVAVGGLAGRADNRV